MSVEETELSRRRRLRITRVKRILRWMPRRSNLHRYPVLRFFAKTARKRNYLWSFRVRAAVPALYAGCILGLLPLYGIQLPIAVGLAFLLRANLPILFSLQFLTNPITVLPAYFASFQIGRILLNLFFTLELPSLDMAEMRALIAAVKDGNLMLNLKYIGAVWGITALGSFVLGTFLATIASAFYKVAAHEVAASYRRLRHLQEARAAASASQTSTGTQPSGDNASSS